MKVKCPTCRQRTEWEDNPFRPFCSERCKLIDLGAWAKGEYIIEGNLDNESGELPSSKEIENA
jgi:endogenous inhibitor of DNA gyrase (YacG/DUF329 family)